MTEEFDSALEGVDDNRRSFLKKMAIGTAFAAPIVSSFTMTGIKAVYAQTPRVSSQVGSGGASASTSTSTTKPTTSTTTPATTTSPPPTTTSSTTTSTTTTTTTTTQPNTSGTTG